MLNACAKLRVSGSRDARVAAIASRQRGRVSRRQLLDAGLSAGQIRDGVRYGRLFPVHAGVYAVGHPAPVPLGAETAALLASPAGTLLSHRSAGALWGMRSVLVDDGSVDVLVAHGVQIRRQGIRPHRSRFHARATPRWHRGLPTTSPAHTLLDLATELRDHDLERVHDEALVERLLVPADCERALATMPTHPGAPHLRALVADADSGVTRSDAEQQLRALLDRGELPRPHCNTGVAGFTVDFLWPEAAFAVEVDGYRFHSTRRRFEIDRARDARLAAVGIEVMRVTWRQLTREPLAVLVRIAAALARRTRHLDG